MSARTARITDLRYIRAVARQREAQALSVPLGGACLATTPLAVLCSSHAFDHRYQTVVLPRTARARGFAQAVARPLRESWDIVRLACLAPDADCYLHGSGDLLEHLCAATAQQGALRTFIRVPAESALAPLAISQGFRAYASEITWTGTCSSLIASAPPPAADMFLRQQRDAWEAFSLYCATTPALVRHAEGRSLREWSMRSRGGGWLALGFVGREIMVGEVGRPQIWLRWKRYRSLHAQVLECFARPDAAHRLGEALRFAAEVLDFDPKCTTICRTREYDGHVSSTLEQAGFGALFHEMLLVKHTVARATERQLLVAALRAQGLGIDISHYHRRTEPAHQRLASSREAD